ncbi:TetR/AcrR family transcriptional regulator [Amycolatopsis jiangsuensis]|uniref:AcrR family transcriptional regulator n=1 Tax=Amycolatopsis jiangsuensis TaxID=1181879 RepID=A0A840J661_9PSEU|nr:TetR family transcriptional regulator [Amycolatopsis jiangsuensis]MBB4689179.1 AcrR family transcriptional regulator [Amycolatopsis jiangsuensis]
MAQHPTPPSGTGEHPPRRRRADAQRNLDALVEAARTVFATSGVDAPAKEITDLAGVGVGTLYRHFPLRSDLVKAVVQTGIDAVAAAGTELAATRAPMPALTGWIDRFVELLGTKRGLASALHSGDPAFADLPGYFLDRLAPTLAALLDAAAREGAIRKDFEAEELIHAIALLCRPLPGQEPGYGRRMTGLLIDGLRLRSEARE